jgi:hypothetical protein
VHDTPRLPDPIDVVIEFEEVVCESVWDDVVVPLPPVPGFELPPQPTAVTAATTTFPPTNASRKYFQVMTPPR